MTKDQQKDLITRFVDDVRDAMLSHADKWPDDWDGFELKWLAREAFDYEAMSVTTRMSAPARDRRRHAFLRHCYRTKFF